MVKSGNEADKENWNYAMTVSIKDSIMDKNSVKGSQFAFPYLEFSGACAGCGETPYIKVITQLFGDRMMIANATGCSSIWGGSAPSMPYTKDAEGRGPAWANSLFEDNAEFGYGYVLAAKQMKDRLSRDLETIKPQADAALKEAIADYENGEADGSKTRAVSEKLVEVLQKTSLSGDAKAAAKDIINHKDFLDKKSIWCLGGDGWAYDIGYGGLDHILASGENINVLVFDTEVYSNTGGQSSKATPEAAIAKFAASGKRVKKKDLGMMAMSYGYVYVAQVGMGADKNQFMKAIIEAENYDGPSLIIAYAPCINHGLKGGMGKSQENIKKAVEAGYWQLYRFNPELEAEGKNPFTLDSKEPTGNYSEFIMDQVRYSSLAKEFPDISDELFKANEEDAKKRLESYKRLAGK
jgi:pyruvate-ferredoxin/flavodoxin oxidoreductase